MEVRDEKSEVKGLERTRWDTRPANSSKSKLVNTGPSGRTVPSVQTPSICPGGADPFRSTQWLCPTSTTLDKPFLLTRKPPQVHRATLFTPTSHECISIYCHPFFSLASQWKKPSSFCPRQKSLFVCSLSLSVSCIAWRNLSLLQAPVSPDTLPLVVSLS